MGSLKESASQTAGPYVHIGLAPGDAGFDIYTVELGRDIAGPEAKGARIAVTGVVYDAEGAPLKDVLVEIWQANADGIYPGAGPVEDGFVGFGRVIPDFETGTFSFTTIKPGAVDGMAPHLNLWLVSRGINIGLSTRMYFGDEERANATDSVLGLIPADRRATLFAEPTDDGYRFDIRLQGDDETVFFAI